MNKNANLNTGFSGTPVFRPLSELNVIDNFLFTTLSTCEDVNEEFFRILLSVFLQRPFRNIKVTAQKIFAGIDTDKHGIRVDAYIEDDPEEGMADATIYDIEAEARYADGPSLPRSSRFYSGIIDVQSLGSGTDYPHMRNLVILTILSYDPFRQGDMWYEASTRLVTHPEVPYDDGVRRIFLYAGGAVREDILAKAGIQDGERVRDMLQYICRSTKENVKNPDIVKVDSLVKRVKLRKEVSISYMQSWEYERLIRQEAMTEGHAAGHAAGHAKGLAEGHAAGLAEGLAEGHAEGLAEGHAEGHAEGLAEGDVLRLIKIIQKKLAKNLDTDTIADHLETDPATVEEIIRVIHSCPEGSEAGIVYHAMREPVLP